MLPQPGLLSVEEVASERQALLLLGVVDLEPGKFLGVPQEALQHNSGAPGPSSGWSAGHHVIGCFRSTPLASCGSRSFRLVCPARALDLTSTLCSYVPGVASP